MISFKQFLQEDEQTLHQLLHAECQPYINEAKGAALLIRGFSQPGKPTYTFETANGELPVYTQTVRKDRKALSTPVVYHEVIDGWMTDKFGIAGRTGSVFVFGEKNIEDATGYGRPYIIIPRGEFQYLWSPNIRDLFIALTGKFGSAARYSGGGLSPEAIIKFLEDANYQSDGLSKASRRNNEIMIECDSYFAIPYNDYNATYIKDLLK